MKKNHHWLLFSKHFFKYLWRFVFKSKDRQYGYTIYGSRPVGWYIICDNGISYKIFRKLDNTLNKYIIHVYQRNNFLFNYETDFFWSIPNVVEKNPLTHLTGSNLERTINIITNTLSTFLIKNEQTVDQYSYYVDLSIYGLNNSSFVGFGLSVISCDKSTQKEETLHDINIYILFDVFYTSVKSYYLPVFGTFNQNFNFPKDVEKKLAKYHEYSTYKFFNNLILLPDGDYDPGFKSSKHDGYLYRIDDHIYYMLISDRTVHYRIYTNGRHITHEYAFHSRWGYPELDIIVAKIFLDFFKHSAIRYPSFKTIEKIGLDERATERARNRGLTADEFTILEMIDF